MPNKNSDFSSLGANFRPEKDNCSLCNTQFNGYSKMTNVNVVNYFILPVWSPISCHVVGPQTPLMIQILLKMKTCENEQGINNNHNSFRFCPSVSASVLTPKTNRASSLSEKEFRTDILERTILNMREKLFTKDNELRDEKLKNDVLSTRVKHLDAQINAFIPIILH